MNRLSPEHTLLVTGGVGRSSSARDTSKVAIPATVPEAQPSVPNATTDIGRSLPAALVIPSIDETSSGLVHRQRFIRFDANRLAPGDPDADEFNRLNDQGSGV